MWDLQPPRHISTLPNRDQVGGYNKRRSGPILLKKSDRKPKWSDEMGCRLRGLLGRPAFRRALSLVPVSASLAS